jgi:hypothetical protein
MSGPVHAFSSLSVMVSRFESLFDLLHEIFSLAFKFREPTGILDNVVNDAVAHEGKGDPACLTIAGAPFGHDRLDGGEFEETLVLFFDRVEQIFAGIELCRHKVDETRPHMSDESRKLRKFDGRGRNDVSVPGERRLNDECATFLGSSADFINDLI